MEQVTGVFVAFVIAAGPLALLTTKGVDLIRNLIDATGRFPRFVWNLVAFVVGVAICVGWGYNLVAIAAASIPAIANSTAFNGLSGEILTGLAVGAMAGFWHEKLDQWHSAAVADRAAAVVVVDETVM